MPRIWQCCLAKRRASASLSDGAETSAIQSKYVKHGQQCGRGLKSFTPSLPFCLFQPLVVRILGRPVEIFCNLKLLALPVTLLEVAMRALGPSRVFGAAALVAVAVLGALLANLLSWPLANVLGPLAFVAVFQMFGGSTLPIQGLRRRFVAVLALFMGAGFTPELAQTLWHWWPSVVAMLVLVPLSSTAGFLLLYLGFRTDRATAWYGAIPGGLMEMSIYGEQEGGDAPAIALLHLLRVISMIVAIPLAFSFFVDTSGRGASAAVLAEPRLLSDWFWYVFLIFAAPQIGLRLRLPAGGFLAPMILACLVYALGWAQAAPPYGLLILTQIVLGAGLGQRFDRKILARFAASFQRSMALSLLAVVLAAAFAGVVGAASHQPWAVLFLAFVPGGLAEMTLLAVSLHVEPVFVSSHHIVRIVVAILVGTTLFSLIKRVAGPKPRLEQAP